MALGDEVLPVMEPLTEEQRQYVTSAEGWPVGYTTRHIAAGFGQCQEWIEAGCSVKPAHIDRDGIHARNAAGLAAHGSG
jgi:N-dimethylarginine dimethylaminohydrolase